MWLILVVLLDKNKLFKEDLMIKSMTKLMLAGLALLAVMVVILPYVGCDTNAGGRTISSGEVGGKYIIGQLHQIISHRKKAK